MKNLQEAPLAVGVGSVGGNGGQEVLGSTPTVPLECSYLPWARQHHLCGQNTSFTASWGIYAPMACWRSPPCALGSNQRQLLCLPASLHVGTNTCRSHQYWRL